MIFLVGGSGLVGSGFARFLKKKKKKFKIITSKNIHKFYNKKCDLLIDCNGNGSKRLANLNPKFDFEASVSSVFNRLINIRFKKYVYISTIYVYPKKEKKISTKENNQNFNNISFYGFNKLTAENYVKHFAKKYMIIRLPYIIGPGLKRNPAHDILKYKKTFYTLNSKLNWIHTDTIAKIVMKLIEKNLFNEIFNVASRNSISIKNILKICNIKEKDLLKTKKVKEVVIVNCEKLKKYIELPNSFVELKKYFNP